MSLDRDIAIHLINTHPMEAALTLERMEIDAIVQTLIELEGDGAHRVLASMQPRIAAAVLESLPWSSATRLLDAAPTRVAVWLLRRVSADRRTEFLDRLDGRRARRIVRGLRSREGTAGALADPDLLVFSVELTVQEALDRHQDALIGLLHPVPVVDEEHRLLGVVVLEDLTIRPRGDKLTALMRPASTAIPSSMERSSVAGLPAWGHASALPVVDGEGILLGMLHRLSLPELGEAAPMESSTPRALGEVFGIGVGGFLESLVSFSAGAPKGHG